MKRIFSILFVLVLAVSLMLVPAAPVGASPGPGLVGQWHLDEGSGTTASDSSEYNNDGTISGASWASGKFGQALSFDGTDDYVQVPSSLSLAPTSALTIEAWVYMVSAPSNMRIVCKPYSTAAWTDPYADYELVVLEETGWAGYPGRAVYFGLTLGGSWTYLATTGTNMVPLNTWTHLAATYNGSTMAIYINGQQKVSNPASGAIASSGQPLFIGSRTPVPNEVFSGKIDEVRIWNEAVKPGTVPLYAGQNMDAGTVTVWNDSTDLHVEYQTEGDWCLTETHLHVATSLDDIPQKNGNPPPGQFDYKAEHDCATAYTYTIPLDEGWVPCETDLVIAAHAEVQKVITEAPYYASTVVNSNQGKTKEGAPVPVGRSTPAQALMLEQNQLETDFFSLGFGGWIIVEFNCPIRNGEGNDVGVWEDTWGAYPTETANVSASPDGTNWTLLGTADNSGQNNIWTLTQLDLGALSWAKYIKVVDTTDPALHNSSAADGLDVNAIVSLQDCIQEETAWGDGLDFPGKNWATYFMYHVQ